MDFIEQVSNVQSVSATATPNASQAATGTRFADWVANEVMTVNDQIHSSELQLQQLATGQTDNLHQVMMSLQKAKLSFEMVVEVRNKVLEGYQEIMRMQL